MKLWIPFALLSSLFAALVAVFTKKCFECPAIDHITATAFNTFIGAIFIGLIALGMGKGKLLMAIDVKTYGFIIAAAIAACLSTLCYFFALNNAPLEHLPAADAFSRLGAIIVLLISIVGFGVPLTIQNGLGILFIILGASFLALR